MTKLLAQTKEAGAAGMGLLQPDRRQRGHAQGVGNDTLGNILDMAVTAEALAATFHFDGLGSGTLPSVNSDASRNDVQAATVAGARAAGDPGQARRQAAGHRVLFFPVPPQRSSWHPAPCVVPMPRYS